MTRCGRRRLRSVTRTAARTAGVCRCGRRLPLVSNARRRRDPTCSERVTVGVGRGGGERDRERRGTGRGGGRRLLAHRLGADDLVELAEPDVAEEHVVTGGVVLEADEARDRHPVRVGVGVVVDLDAVEEHLDALALDDDLVRVPLPGRLERGVAGGSVRGAVVVDRPGGGVRVVGGVDLDLVPARERDVPVVAGIGEADEHAGVVVARELPVQLEAVLVEALTRPPEHAGVAHRLQRAVRLAGERAGAGLAPAGEAVERAVEQARVARARGPAGCRCRARHRP